MIPLKLDAPTGDFTEEQAMSEAEFIEAVAAGYDAVPASADLLCLGEMGIGNTTAASALAAALLGGGGERWAGRGTGLDDAGLARKRDGDRRWPQASSDPSRRPARREHDLRRPRACRHPRRHARRAPSPHPVLLDGFVATAAAAPLARLNPSALDHAQVAHCSAEAGHRGLCAELGMRPILDLDMRLGEGSGAALSVSVLRAALACHLGMATFDEAGVDERG